MDNKDECVKKSDLENLVLQDELNDKKMIEEERRASDAKYAGKLVETIIFALVSMAAASVVGLIIKAIFS